LIPDATPLSHELKAMAASVIDARVRAAVYTWRRSAVIGLAAEMLEPNGGSFFDGHTSDAQAAWRR
jgi:hypothetical protein